MEEENGRWARVNARAGERLAMAEAVRWRNIVRGEMVGWRGEEVWNLRMESFQVAEVGEQVCRMGRWLLIGRIMIQMSETLIG